MQKLKYAEIKEKSLLIKEQALDYKTQQFILNSNLKNIKKDYGIFFTPEWLVDFMVNLIDIDKLSSKEDISILEPACGLAQFLFGIKRNHSSLFERAKLIGIEINQEVINYLVSFDISSKIELIKEDYLLWETDTSFDLIIGNPPYGIPSLSEHYTIKVEPEIKKKYKTLYETWYGKYNVYGAFIEKSIKLLTPEGQLIFIVPATFMILDEFKKLRKFLSQNGGTAIIYLGSDVFSPEADVSCVILDFVKSKEFVNRVEILEYHRNKIKAVKINSNWQGEVITFETDYSKKLDHSCSHKLGDIYEIRISPRTPEIKNNPYIVKAEFLNKQNYLPLLNGRNLKCNEIIYENLTGYWIKKADINKLRGYFNIPHIVVGLGFRENGRVAAAYDEKCYPWMGDVYHLIRKTNLFNLNFDMSEQEVVEYLNSDYVKRYVKDIYREITYHLSITQLKNLPLPNKKEWKRIKKEISL
ncbi:TaqI-like C-terminal specificity domain-containing protein [Thermodesulfovibrio sp. Kuro-1]|uniref:TaqI-like C-terminal specificity domain-containing protein n=1 Tax=Thermodesulfovibrio sp. Kuro-1 TaxID=2580394 RepID=UPI00114492D8|nr:TaqI-like C-terminal specificity domain-containing protein [Thermodesulfovibrio sp. Kuro-1]